MKKFKPGDKVQVICNQRNSSFKIGEIYTIKKIENENTGFSFAAFKEKLGIK